MNALDQMRFNRAKDELDSYSPAKVGAYQVLGNPWLTLPGRGMCVPYHVKDQTFKVTPAWCEFLEVTYLGVRLRDMDPQMWAAGTLLYLECVMRWHVRPGKKAGVDIYHKDGGYGIKIAEVIQSLSSLNAIDAPADLSVTGSEINRDSTFRFLLGTVGNRSVTPSSHIGSVYPSSQANPFGLDITFNI